MDEYAKYGVSWRDYVTDLPDTALIPSNLERYPQDYTNIHQFYADARLGTLPDVSYVESDGGVVPLAADPVRDQVRASGAPQPQRLTDAFYRADGANGDEEDADVRVGQAFVARIVNAVMTGKDWQHTLLIWLYDEHGGFYDHVPPPRAVKPDAIPPKPSAGDVKGGYDMYGVRVPAVVVSAWSRPHAVTNVLHAHLDPRRDRTPVEPAGIDLPRRQRQRPPGLPRPEPATLRHTSSPRRTRRHRTAQLQRELSLPHPRRIAPPSAAARESTAARPPSSVARPVVVL